MPSHLLFHSNIDYAIYSHFFRSEFFTDGGRFKLH